MHMRSNMDISTLLDLARYPIHEPTSDNYRALMRRTRETLLLEGLCNLPGFVKEDALASIVSPIAERMREHAFTHSRKHNIYFVDSMPGLAADHAALTQLTTTNHTLCADQLLDNPLTAIYEFPPLARFLSDVLDQPQYVMTDHLARLNVMAYRDGEALNWHFDCTYATTTLLLQNAEVGGEFQYRRGLRSTTCPDYEGVARLVSDADPAVRTLALSAGTLNLFLGEDTAHRTTPVSGARERLVAVFSYYDREGVEFSREERIGFYGRPA